MVRSISDLCVYSFLFLSTKTGNLRHSYTRALFTPLGSSKEHSTSTWDEVWPPGPAPGWISAQFCEVVSGSGFRHEISPCFCRAHELVRRRARGCVRESVVQRKFSLSQ